MEEESRKSFAQITLYNQLIKEMDEPVPGLCKKL